MNPPDAWIRLLASLHDAALDADLWPAASERLDEAIGVKGNALLAHSGPEDDAVFRLGVCLYRGELREDLGRQYLDYYHRFDPRLPRLRRLPAGRLVHVTELHTELELKTSPGYNEFCPRSDGSNCLNVRLGSPDGSDFTWVILDPVGADWQSAQTRTIERVLPHVRRFVQVRQALARAHAGGGTVVDLLDSARLGVIHLDPRGRIVELNDNARDVLAQDNGLSETDGYLRAWLPGDDLRLKGLLAAALPGPGGQAVGGALRVRHALLEPGLTLHVHPVTARAMDFGAPLLGALVLIEGLAGPRRFDAGLVGAVLGLSPAESRVAVLLAEGRTVPDIAAVFGRAHTTVRSHVRRIHRKLGVSRRADLVRLVLSVPQGAGFRQRR